MAAGTHQLDAVLAQLINGLSGPALQHCTQAAAAPIVAQAQQRAPVLRGDVRDRIGTVSSHTETSATTAVQVAESGPNGVAHEAIFLEYGTARMAAQPFMRPALAAAQGDALGAFAAALKSNLRT